MDEDMEDECYERDLDDEADRFRTEMREDGWSNEDILKRHTHAGGRYLGEKGNPNLEEMD